METVPVTLGQFLSAGAMVGLLYWLLVSGRLVPRITHEDLKEDRNYWRAAHVASEVAREKQTQALHTLMEIGRTTEAYLRAQQEGGNHNAPASPAPDRSSG